MLMLCKPEVLRSRPQIIWRFHMFYMWLWAGGKEGYNAGRLIGWTIAVILLCILDEELRLEETMYLHLKGPGFKSLSWKLSLPLNNALYPQFLVPRNSSTPLVPWLLVNRPYALTSRLHNNDAMLGFKTCRAARKCCAGSIGALSQFAGPGRPGGMACRGWPAGCMLGDGARDSASFDPQHTGAPFCDVICIRSILKRIAF